MVRQSSPTRTKVVSILTYLLLFFTAAQIPQRGSKLTKIHRKCNKINSFAFCADCKRKEDTSNQSDQLPTPKKPRLVFTDLQRRTLQAIFKVSSDYRLPMKTRNVIDAGTFIIRLFKFSIF